MPDFNIELLLQTGTAQVWDTWCAGTGDHAAETQWRETTHLQFPYRGLFVRHRDAEICVAEAGQVLLCNAGESYRITHPVPGGDSSLVVLVELSMLREL